MGSWEDSLLESAVESAIEQQPGMGGSAILVDVEEGRIRIRGYVHTAAQRERALSGARGFGGVAQVEDGLLLTP